MRSTVVVVIAVLGAVAYSAPAAAAPGSPVIRESFTVLPCPVDPVSTLALEGCAEKALLGSDRAINARSRRIFGLLRSNVARDDFVRGEQSWLDYRRSSCAAESSKYAEGSLEPVAFAHCEQSRNRAHLLELGELEHTLAQR
jgi:uncharacterized protein YecT (DUF1311 family)